MYRRLGPIYKYVGACAEYVVCVKQMYDRFDLMMYTRSTLVCVSEAIDVKDGLLLFECNHLMVRSEIEVCPDQVCGHVHFVEPLPPIDYKIKVGLVTSATIPSCNRKHEQLYPTLAFMCDDKLYNIPERVNDFIARVKSPFRLALGMRILVLRWCGVLPELANHILMLLADHCRVTDYTEYCRQSQYSW